MKPLRIFLLAALFLVFFGSLEGVEANETYDTLESNQEPIWESLTTGEVYSMSTSPDGHYIVVGTDASKAASDTTDYPQILFFEKNSSTPLWSQTTNGRVNDVDISADGEYIAAVTGVDLYDEDGEDSEAGHVYLFRKSSNIPIIDYTVENGRGVWSVAISEDGEYIAATTHDSPLLSPNNHESILYFFRQNNSEPIWNFTSDYPFSNVGMSANGDYIVAGDWNNTIYFFTKDNNTPFWNYTLGECDFWEGGMCRLWVSISENGEYIVAGSTNGGWEQGTSPIIYLFGKNNNTPIWNREIEGTELNVLDISANGKYIGAGFTINGGTTGIKQTGRFYLLDSVGNEIWDYSSNRAVMSIAFSAEGESVVIGVIDFGIHYFSNTSSVPIWTYTFGSGPVPAYISANGDYIIAGLGDVGHGGGVALLSKNLTSEIVDGGGDEETLAGQCTCPDGSNGQMVGPADDDGVDDGCLCANSEEEILLSSISLIPALISIGLIAIFRRK